MAFPPEEISTIVQEIATILRSRKQTLSVSEAACGGLLSAYVVSVPGASDFYIGGKLLYSLRTRLKLSGWSDTEISNYMGPSEQVALKLARTTKYELGSTYVLSETGFAGPSTDLHLKNGDSKEEEKETSAGVGTVYIGLSGPNGDASSSFHTGITDRSENMAEFAKLGLTFLLDQLKQEDKKA
ncbi:CinA-like protein [Candida viswanathii]|uniref:CinA-like protein n=1 Tax=Candida viswanathii TaxID=5486 RepID=A0A367Y3I4_9ASCO|nr:CinA-like protein [Candida viswanathii]